MQEHSSNLMPLLTELRADGECLFYKLVAPNGARALQQTLFNKVNASPAAGIYAESTRAK
jgi:hypothetical protein